MSMFQVWVSLADRYLASIKINWEKTCRFAFNEKSNPDDNKLGLQIVKVKYMILSSINAKPNIISNYLEILIAYLGD